MVNKLLNIIYPLFWYLVKQIMKVVLTYFVASGALLLDKQYPWLILVAGICGICLLYLTVTTFFSVLAYTLHLLFPKWNYSDQRNEENKNNTPIFNDMKDMYGHTLGVRTVIGYLTGVKI